MASLRFLVPYYALNMPFYLKSTLNQMSGSTKRVRSPVVSLTSHGLVQLLIINALLQAPVTQSQFIELPNNELAQMLALQPANIEAMGAILPDQEANADQREEVDQGNNQVEVAELVEETKHTLDQEEYFTEASYVPDQDDDPEEVEESQEEENSATPTSPPKNFMATLLRRKKTTTQNLLLAFVEIVMLILHPSMKNQKNMKLLHKNHLQKKRVRLLHKNRHLPSSKNRVSRSFHKNLQIGAGVWTVGSRQES